MPYFREDQAAIHVLVSGVSLDTVPWRTFKGGDRQAQSTNTRPGGMLPAIAMGGPTTRSDVTVERVYSDVLHLVYYTLDALTGQASMQCSYTPLDANGHPAGDTFIYTGTLDSVARPEYDANATNSAGLLTLVMNCNEQISKASN